MPGKLLTLCSTILLVGIFHGLAFAASRTTLTISGTEQQISGTWDAGTITVSFGDSAGNWYKETVAYGQFSTPASIAASVASMFTRDYYSSHKLCAYASGSTVTFTLRTVATLGQPSINGSSTSFSLVASGGYGPGMIMTVAGIGPPAAYSGDGGPALNAQFNSPMGVIADTVGNLYIADTLNNRVRKIDASTGIVTTVAGNGYTTTNSWGGYSGDGGPATSAELNWPMGLALDASGNLYIADYGNSRIRKVLASTGIITTVAGTGFQAYGGDGGPATSAYLYDPQGVAVDSSGNIYIADTFNNLVRKINASTGVITTVGGTGGPYVQPRGIAVDSVGNIYFVDSGNYLVRKIDASSGIVTNIAGTGFEGYSGDGGLATNAALLIPYGLALDSSNNVYITEYDSRIREVKAATGVINTIAGTGTNGYSGDGGPAINAQIGLSEAICTDRAGNIYFADGYDVVRKITPIQSSPPIAWYPQSPIVYGTALSSAQLNASSTVPGSFTYSPPANTLLTAGAHILTATFFPSDMNTYSVATAHATLNVAKTTPSINWASPANITSGTALSAAQLNATANVPGVFSYSPALGTVLGVGSHALAVTFTPSDTVNYSVASATVYITVSQPTIVFDQGSISLSVNTSVIATASYGQGATPSSIAGQLVASLSSGSPVNVTAVDDTIYLQAKSTGSATNYLYSLQTMSYNSTNFSQPSFLNPPLSGSLTGGVDANTAAGIVYSFTGGYDGAGNLLSYSDSVMGNWSFQYDTLNRLIGSSGSQPNNPSPYYCWSYDAFGNRTQQVGASVPFVSGSPNCTPASGASLATQWAHYSPSNNNQLSNTSQAVGGVGYDSAGEVTHDGVNQYLYDGAGRICAEWSNGLMTGYIYDADGRRVAKGQISSWSCDPSISGFTPAKDYILGLGGEQVTEMAMSNNVMTWEHTNVYASGSLIATYDSDGVHFHLDDPLGTRRAQTNYAGILEQTCASLPFGDSLSCSNSTQFPTEHHFTGKERDTESGNDYFGARYYASTMGRFLSPDWSAKAEPVPYAKLDDPQSLNLYSYVRNNPLNRFDPDGHQDYCKSNPGSLGCGVQTQWNNTHGIIPDGTLKQLDQVAMKAEKTALGKTRADLKNGFHREWGGLILQNNETGAFSATSPITSNKEREVNVDKVAVPDGSTVVGEYHTHPHNTLAEGIGPSDGDVGRLQNIARQTHELRVGYVGETAGGYVSRYTAYESGPTPYGVVIGVVPPQ